MNPTLAGKSRRHLGTDHHERMVTPEKIETIEKLAWHYDEPFADPSALPTYFVSQVAREKVTVALSGDGGDENFAGYSRYFLDQQENRMRSLLPLGFRRTLFRSTRKPLSKTGLGSPVPARENDIPESGVRPY